jgi:ribulose-phosphate 3-epimerase
MESLFTEGEEGLKFKIDVHLMVKEPIDWINRSLLVLPDRIIGQVEFMENPLNFINEVINSGVEVGIALDLDTPVNSISDDIYHLVDIILIMGVKAGLGGQVFERSIVSKIEEIRKIVGENVEIGIDGGLDEESIELCKKAGVNIFYVGNSFWSAYDKSSSDKPAEDLEKRYNDLEQLIK